MAISVAKISLTWPAVTWSTIARTALEGKKKSTLTLASVFVCICLLAYQKKCLSKPPATKFLWAFLGHYHAAPIKLSHAAIKTKEKHQVLTKHSAKCSPNTAPSAFTAKQSTKCYPKYHMQTKKQSIKCWSKKHSAPGSSTYLILCHSGATTDLLFLQASQGFQKSWFFRLLTS